MVRGDQRAAQDHQYDRQAAENRQHQYHRRDGGQRVRATVVQPRRFATEKQQSQAGDRAREHGIPDEEVHGTGWKGTTPLDPLGAGHHSRLSRPACDDEP